MLLKLRVLEDEIEARVRHITESVDTWPCRKGCDACCRSLATVPRATALEWSRIEAALERLPHLHQRQIRQRIAALADNDSRPVTCPFLECETGACLIYEVRPVECRTYGFYLERDRGLYCAMIEQQVERGDYPDVVWGNHVSVEARLAEMGESTDLLTWYRQTCFHQTSAETPPPGAAGPQ